jgi:hypothetical protein
VHPELPGVAHADLQAHRDEQQHRGGQHPHPPAPADDVERRRGDHEQVERRERAADRPVHGDRIHLAGEVAPGEDGLGEHRDQVRRDDEPQQAQGDPRAAADGADLHADDARKRRTA